MSKLKEAVIIKHEVYRTNVLTGFTDRMHLSEKINFK